MGRGRGGESRTVVVLGSGSPVEAMDVERSPLGSLFSGRDIILNVLHHRRDSIGLSTSGVCSEFYTIMPQTLKVRCSRNSRTEEMEHVGG